ncbi:hypothetical protein EHS25_009539 [Saitozyma podzolica]|uniref:Uncharacterized protein n=1 Tax=Saitozyma podzolica TaxID=1890683 RepID=A0A427YJH2_9TREE|nr:hypothetical protein EHS25_009539 [Saitozyma podzolica]
MTSLNPSHNPFRHPSGRHAQAVHQPSAPSSSFPDDLPIPDSDSDSEYGVDEHLRGERRARREGRKRVRAAMPRMPDLRFEQVSGEWNTTGETIPPRHRVGHLTPGSTPTPSPSLQAKAWRSPTRLVLRPQSYLLSIRPFLTPRPTRHAVAARGPVPVDEKNGGPGASLVEPAQDDAVFHWGREVDVNWRMVSWVTIRDQVISPLVQGALWGWGTLLLVSTAASLRSALYPPSHIPQGRVTGGPGGKVKEAGGGSAVGTATGWWRSFVKSWTGAVETAAI